MTEYDFSPEAQRAHVNNMYRVSRWVENAENHRAEFVNAAALMPEQARYRKPLLHRQGSGNFDASPLALRVMGRGTLSGGGPSCNHDSQPSPSPTSSSISSYQAQYAPPLAPPALYLTPPSSSAPHCAYQHYDHRRGHRRHHHSGGQTRQLSPAASSFFPPAPAPVLALPMLQHPPVYVASTPGYIFPLPPIIPAGPPMSYVNNSSMLRR